MLYIAPYEWWVHEIVHQLGGEASLDFSSFPGTPATFAAGIRRAAHRINMAARFRIDMDDEVLWIKIT